MKASSLILSASLLALSSSLTTASAFPGAAGPYSGAHGRSGGHEQMGAHGIVHALGRYGGFALVPDVPPPVEPPAPVVEQPALEAPDFAPALPQPYAIPAARPRRSGPKIIYIGRPPKGDGPRIIYGTE